MAGGYWIETLGCPKNAVDSDKLAGTMAGAGMTPAGDPAEADVVVVNTCAFIEAARQESIDTILALAETRRSGARLVVTGCMAERYGEELAAALPEVDLVAGFGDPRVAEPPGGVAVAITTKPAPPPLDLLNLPRPAATAPWAYVKVAEGCDRACGFCAIPSFRGRQRSREPDAVVAEAEALGVAEVVLVAQDLASYGRDIGRKGALAPLVAEVARRVPRVRLLYLYPSELNDTLVDAILATGVAYFDLSLQHASRPLLRRMRRWGEGERFLDRMRAIRAAAPEAAFRSSFIVGYPGETDDDHEVLVDFLEEARLDWAGFFPYSKEDGTYAAGLDGEVPAGLVAERLAELSGIQESITAERRRALVGRTVDVLVDRPGVARSHREAPEIDGVIQVPDHLATGSFHSVTVTAAVGPDVWAVPATEAGPRP